MEVENDTYVDGPETGTMPRSHILVEALHSIDSAEFTELLVHVVCAGTRIVSEPDTKVLDFQGFLL